MPIGATIISIILASDQTHLTNFSGDKKLWPIYMTVGNIYSSIRNRPSYHVWLPIAFLPIPPKRVEKIPGYTEAHQELHAMEVFHWCIWQLLCPLADYVNSTKLDESMQVRCGDNNL